MFEKFRSKYVFGIDDVMWYLVHLIIALVLIVTYPIWRPLWWIAERIRYGK